MTNRTHSPKRPVRALIHTIMAIQVFVFSVEAFAFQARSTAPKGAGWSMAEVVTDGALIHQTPNDAAYVTDEANRGDLLWIREISSESEWVQVKPPTGAISWILESDISEIRTGEGRVSAQQTRIRPGRHGARLPGPPGVDLPSGTTVWILSREPLVIPQRQGLMTWRAIEPPAVEPRFLRKESLRKIAERKEPEPDGFVAAKGPGMLAATDQPDAQEFSDQSPRSSESPKKPTKGPEEPMGKLAEDRSTRSGEQMADQPRSIDDLEILDIPQTLSGGSSAPIDNGVVDTPVRPSMPKIAPIADVGSDANSPPAGPVSPLELPSDPDAALETLESRFRVIMSEPLISWDFRPVLLACESLGQRELSAGQASRLNRLKTLAERQEEIGRSSREFWNSMRRSRSHDPANQIQATPVAARSASRFDISGLLLPSQRDVDGHLLYNLIGDSGLTIAYLKLPPAAPVEKWLGKKVGIRGRVRYHEDLRGRLVTVQDVEILEP